MINKNTILNIEAYLSFFKNAKDITSKTYFSISEDIINAVMEREEKDIVISFNLKDGICKKIKVIKCCDKKGLVESL